MNKIKYIILYGNRAGHTSPSVLVRRANSERWYEKQITDATAQRLQRVLCDIKGSLCVTSTWLSIIYWL